MSCLDANVVADLVEQRLDEALRATVEAHVAACGDCRALVGELVRGDATRTVELAPGAQLGRYLVIRRLGTGGMGVVYAAHDPELDREVALKVLRADVVDPIAMHERLLREARTMAKLSHPGVVAIHDVGAADGRVFVAMDLVVGITLRDWMRGERTTREICDAFAQAGRGLAAVHAAGLVHGDFKPDNVLVRDDGRIQVTDFGLARLMAPDGADPLVSSICGTPAYMSPEQASGRADARSDQFSFCASLYEALAGARAPAPLDAPRWLRRLIGRGLSADSAARFRSMDALVGELTRDRRRTRRRVALATAALVIAAASIAAVTLPQHRRLATCAHTGDRLAGTWDPAHSDAIRRAFLATGKPFAQDEWRGVDRVLSARAHSWTTLATAACEADARGMPPDDARVACLADSSDEIRTLAERLAIAEPSIVEHAVRAAELVRDARACNGSLPALPRDPVRRAQALRGLGDLVLLHVAESTGDLVSAHLTLDGVLAELKALDYEPMYVLALADAATFEGSAGSLDAMRSHLDEALLLAEKVGDDRGRVLAMLGDVAAGWTSGDYATSSKWLARASAVVDRIGAEHDPLLAAKLASMRCTQMAFESNAAGTAAACHELVVQAERAEGSSSVDTANAYIIAGQTTLATSLQGRRDEDFALVRRGLAIEEAELGPEHPMLIEPLAMLAMTECLAGRVEACVADAERAERIASDVEPGTEMLATAEVGLAQAQQAAGHGDAALAAGQRAIAVEDALAGKSPQTLLSALEQVARLELTAKRPGDALATLARVESVAHEALPVASSSWAMYYVLLAETDRALHRLPAAADAFERALKVDSPGMIARDRLGLAMVLWELGRDRKRAIVLARAAVADVNAPPPQREQAKQWLIVHAK